MISSLFNYDGVIVSSVDASSLGVWMFAHSCLSEVLQNDICEIGFPLMLLYMRHFALPLNPEHCFRIGSSLAKRCTMLIER